MKTTPKAKTKTHDTTPDRIAKEQVKINGLLKSAKKLYSQSKATDRKLLYQRVELGRVLIELKTVVGHGNFIEEFKKWSQEERIGFSLKTGQRAMAYSEMESGGKFVDADKNDIVSNLADAERLRKDEAEIKKNAGKKSASDGDAEGGDDQGDAPVTLKKSQIGPNAKALARPLIMECRGYDGESKQALLEELIELLAKELER